MTFYYNGFASTYSTGIFHTFSPIPIKIDDMEDNPVYV
jgi:hypothetical protein